MAEERIPVNTYDGGWEAGAVGDIDELVADADGNAITTTTKSDQCILTFDVQTVVDGDTVTAVDFVMRAQESSSAGNNTIDFTFDGTTVSVPMLVGYTNFTVSDPAWDGVDYTVAQLEGNVTIDARQSGMPAANTWSIDCVDMIITYTAGGGGLDIPVAMANYRRRREF